MVDTAADRWHGASAYEVYIGRWSRSVAEVFVAWLGALTGRSWLDVGCGTGALATSIMALAEPACLVAIDRSADFVAHAGEELDDPRVVLLVGDAVALPLAPGRVDAVVSGLLLNFLPDPLAAVAELIELAPSARAADEAVRFPLCQPDLLQSLFVESGLGAVRTRVIDVEARFRDFDDYWTPFLSGVGPAPGYCAALPADQREALRKRLLARLSPSGAGPIVMNARAFAVRGTVPAAGA